MECYSAKLSRDIEKKKGQPRLLFFTELSYRFTRNTLLKQMFIKIKAVLV